MFEADRTTGIRAIVHAMATLAELKVTVAHLERELADTRAALRALERRFWKILLAAISGGGALLLLLTERMLSLLG